MVFTATSRCVLQEVDKAWRCKVTLRVASCVASAVAIGCIAWITATSSLYKERYVWDWQTLPWDFIPLSLCIIGNLTVFVLWTIDLRLFLRSRNIALDFILTLNLFAGTMVVIAGAIPTLTWSADDWYNNDDPSGIAYKVIVPSGSIPWIPPPRNDTPCSGFQSCTAQDSFTATAHHRGMVGLVGAAFTAVAAINHIILFIWALARNRKCARLKTIQEVGELQAIGRPA